MAPYKVDREWLEYVNKLVNIHPFRSLTPATGRKLLEHIEKLQLENKSLRLELEELGESHNEENNTGNI